jgi:hypothetical protein
MPGLSSIFGDALKKMVSPKKKKKYKMKKMSAEGDRVGSPNLGDAAKQIKKNKDAKKKQLEQLD